MKSGRTGKELFEFLSLEDVQRAFQEGDELVIQTTLVSQSPVTYRLIRQAPDKSRVTLLSFTGAAEFTGTFDVFKMKVAQGPRKEKGLGRFPFQIKSFEVNAGIFKVTFEKKKK